MKECFQIIYGKKTIYYSRFVVAKHLFNFNYKLYIENIKKLNIS